MVQLYYQDYVHYKKLPVLKQSLFYYNLDKYTYILGPKYYVVFFQINCRWNYTFYCNLFIIIRINESGSCN